MNTKHTRQGFTQGCFPKGFTLIELLVVVLIISILAAIAVPQYQLAVAKSRFAEMSLFFREIIKAEDLYYLANGKYTMNYDRLYVDFQSKKGQENHTNYDNFECHINLTYEEIYCDSNFSPAITIHAFFRNGKNKNSASPYCTSEDSVGKKICQSLGGNKINDSKWVFPL